MAVVKRVTKVLQLFGFTTKKFMKKFLLSVNIVLKSLKKKAILKSMLMLFIWIWKISNVMNVINLLDKKEILKLTLELSIEMRRISNVIHVGNLLDSNKILTNTLEMSTRCKNVTFVTKHFIFVKGHQDLMKLGTRICLSRVSNFNFFFLPPYFF